MKIQVPEKVTTICRILYNEGFNSWIVGGCVRDAILGRKAHDWDIATTATPNEVINTFEKTIPTGIEFGTITVMIDREGFEVTTLRKDGSYGDGRRPDNVTYSTDIVEDLSRRDFTMNAMAYNVMNDKLIDPFGGMEDIDNQIIRTVGNPVDRFNEDGLRLMRAARFSATHNMTVDFNTARAMHKCRSNIISISKERIRDELLKSLSTDRPSTTFNLLERTGILHLILSDLVNQVGCKQNAHHEYNVWDHTMEAVDHCNTSDAILKLAVLLHDLGKPYTQTPKDGYPGEFTFYKHGDVGAELADKWLRVYKFSNEERSRVVHLVRHHGAGAYYIKSWSRRAIRRFILKIGIEHLDDFFAIRIADLRGKGKDADELLELVVDLAVRVQEVLEAGEPVDKSQLAINGHDVQEKLQIKPGPAVGRALTFLFETILDNPEVNTREKLLNLLEEFGR